MREYAAAESLIDELVDVLGTSPWAEVYTLATGDRGALPVAVGVGKDGDQYRLAVFGSDPVMAGEIVARAHGEADVYLIDQVKPRVTSTWTQQPRDILGIGLQWGPMGFGWVGTGGIPVRAAEDPRIILFTTNEHVVGEGAPRGRIMHQGGRARGVVWSVGGLVYGPSQRWDVASVAVDRTVEINPVYDQGIDANLRGIRRMGAEDIGRRFWNTGQTRGSLEGSCIAVGVRDLTVGYDGGVGRFHDQAAFVGVDGKPFSVGGHSGSTIVCVEDKHACSLLFAGGRDGEGRDVTFGAADLPGAIVAAGGIPELIAA